MNTQLQDRLSTLEQALDTLVDSITSYNPSPAAAQTLGVIDTDFNRDLETLSQHQKNFETLESLRKQSQRLDDQIRDTLRTLNDTRKELIGARRPKARGSAANGGLSAITGGGNPLAQPVNYKELLATAQRIARYTTPPKKRQDPVVKPEAAPAPANDEQTNGEVVNGINTTAATPAPEETNAATPSHRTMDRIAPHLHGWIDPPQGADGQPIYTPWPNENVIRSGALGLVQKMIEEGTNPDTVSVPVEAQTEEAVVEGSKAAAVERAPLDPEEAARRQEERRRLQEQERQRQEATFDEFDLYDPDAD